MSQYRTHTCGELRAADAGKTVTLAGWMENVREVGSNFAFVVLRDFYCTTQIVVDSAEMMKTVKGINKESTIAVTGTVRLRESPNAKLATGEIEVVPEKIEILGRCRYNELPFEINRSREADESARLKYRYLDLRNPAVKNNIILRCNVVAALRRAMMDHGFLEITTPILTASSPEGARDYLVPARKHPGKFYALPQAPQQFKQLLMTSGFDRYFQIAPCFRDEDARGDRSPGEFYQLDMEMAFADQDDVFAVLEDVLPPIFAKFGKYNVASSAPFRRIGYNEAMERYGSDKPDTRFGFELRKLNDTVKDCSFKVFTDCLANGGDVRGICVTGGSEQFSRKDIDKLTDMTKAYGAKGLVWIRVNDGEYKSSVDKFFSQEELAEIAKVFDAKKDDLIFICSDRAKVTYDSLGFLRRECAKRMGLLDDNQYNLLWVVDFPMFEEDEEDHSLKAMHHPFTCPKLDQLELLDTDPLAVKADAYDIVLNGVELGGGSVRIHDKNLQAKMFEVLGLTKEECDEKFGFLIEAFKYGAPPHAGLAYGLDRFVMLLLGEPSIREVIAFPKNQNAQCLVSSAPSPVDQAQLDELRITTKQNN